MKRFLIATLLSLAHLISYAQMTIKEINGLMYYKVGNNSYKLVSIPALDSIKTNQRLALKANRNELTDSLSSARIKSNQLYRPAKAIGGDVLIPVESGTATLATVNSAPGTFGNSTNVVVTTVDAKGRVTGVVSTPISLAGIGGLDSIKTNQRLALKASLQNLNDSLTNARSRSNQLYRARGAITGDVAIGDNTNTATLATVNSTPGTFGNATTVPVHTVDGKGRITGVITIPISLSGIGGLDSTRTNQRLALKANQQTLLDSMVNARSRSNQLYRLRGAITGDVAIADNGTTATLATVNSAPGTFGTATTVAIPTVDAKGRVTGVTSTPISLTGIGGITKQNTLDSLSAYRQKAVAPADTNTGSGLANASALRAIDNNPYIIDNTGKKRQVTVTLRTIAEFSTTTHTSVNFDGSIWKRVTGITTTTATAGYGWMQVPGPGSTSYRRVFADKVNVFWAGAVGDGNTNDAVAIQKAADFVKAYKTPGGGTGRPILLFPPGYSFKVNTPIDLTNANGIAVEGAGTGYQQSTIVGNTGGIILDFTGSTKASCNGIHFYVANNTGTPSTVGVLLSLGQVGAPGSYTLINGLRSQVTNCYFQFESNPTANGGLGNVGILDNRNEETAFRDNMIAADSPLILTYTPVVATRYGSYTFTSSNATYQMANSGSGSMGVVSIDRCSFTASSHVNHAVTLNGVNSVNFQSCYFWGNFYVGGSETHAIGIYNNAIGLTINGTVEGYPGAILIGDGVAGTQLIQANINLAHANLYNVTTPEIYMLQSSNAGYPSKIVNSQIKVCMANGGSEIGSRYFLQTPIVGDNPVSSIIDNSSFEATNWPNSNMISPQLLKQAKGIVQASGTAYYNVKGLWYEYTHPSEIALGSLTSVSNNATLLTRLSTIDNPVSTTVNNGGFYTVEVEGVVQAGIPNSTPFVMANIKSKIAVNQLPDGTRIVGSTLTEIINKYTTNSALLDITGVTLSFDWSGAPNAANINIRLSGSGSAASSSQTTFRGIVRVGSLGTTKRAIVYIQ